jgi:regulatory protein
MGGRRRGRTGRGWDAAPARAPRSGDAAPARAQRRTRSNPKSTEKPSDPAELAREICLRLLAVRPRTRAELATALRRRDIDERVAAEVLDRYHDVGMVDDTAFAQAWVTSRHHSRGLARRALGSELRRRGVAPETVGQALDQLDTDTETVTARALVDRKLRTMTGQPEAIVRRLVGMLARKGYPAGLAYRVVKEALADDERTVELADRLDPDALADAAGPDEADPAEAGPDGPSISDN